MKIKDILTAINKQNKEVYARLCWVREVNEDVCTCEPVDGSADVLEVKLIADAKKGFLLIPKIGSIVIIDFLNDNQAFISMFSELEGVELNGANFGGLIKIEELKSELDKVNQVLQGLLNILTGTPIMEPGNGAPSALQTSLAAALAGKTLPNYNSIENNLVTHGSG